MRGNSQMGQFQAVYVLLKYFSFRYPPPERMGSFKVGKVSREIQPPGNFPENLHRVFLWMVFCLSLKTLSLILIRNRTKSNVYPIYHC